MIKLLCIRESDIMENYGINPYACMECYSWSAGVPVCVHMCVCHYGSKDNLFSHLTHSQTVATTIRFLFKLES